MTATTVTDINRAELPDQPVSANHAAAEAVPDLSRKRLYVLGLALALTNVVVAFDTTILVLEVGSIICATASSSPILILGRAISGCGSAGVSAGAFAIIGHLAPLRERPRIIAMFMALQSVAFAAGPTLSSVFTSSAVTWRFNFWVNLPIGFGALFFVWFAVPRDFNDKRLLPLLEKLRRCDPFGSVLLALCLVPLFLGLEWGGNVAPFASPQVWGCFLASGLSAVAFVALLAVKKNNAVIPLRIFKQRTIAVCISFSALYGMAQMIHASMLATYFQTVHDISITMSAVYQIPSTISSIVSSIIANLAISAWNHYLPFLWGGPPIFLAGAVLMHTFSTDSARAELLGYQVPAGIGFGLAVSTTLVAIQGVSSTEDLASACVADAVSAQVGRAVGVSIAQNLFVGLLNNGLREIVPAEEAAAFAQNGLERMIESMKTMDEVMRQQFREVLNTAVVTALLIPVAALSMAIVVSWFAERRVLVLKTVVERQAMSEDQAPGKIDGVQEESVILQDK
ncbi:major facilitator superfamily domain-containing protein [Microdochium trichocladiopsis]|uniref:Major facilitator superfamily domain-containing protein n=1 Tax=Microdochium trichocladiopsis TaxID=1682393 RepID=A0A9P9BL70_9PEZI|nr:major facilitator superfamily domain-containing protein [Microdochium trichocladiopsis]KAH7012489.1 major facilitator superfamily domain-containing protein [Microdochium trichocladiopsis]